MIGSGLQPAIFCSDLGVFLGGLSVGVYPQGVGDCGAMQYGGMRFGHGLMPLADVPGFSLSRGAELEGLSKGGDVFISGRAAATEFALDWGPIGNVYITALKFEEDAKRFLDKAANAGVQEGIEFAIAAAITAEIGAFAARGFDPGAARATDAYSLVARHLLLVSRHLHGRAADFWLAALDAPGGKLSEDVRLFINRGILNAWLSIGNAGALRSFLEHSRARNELGRMFSDAASDSFRLAYFCAHGLSDANFLAAHDALREAERLLLLGGLELNGTQRRELKKLVREAFALHLRIKSGRKPSNPAATTPNALSL